MTADEIETEARLWRWQGASGAAAWFFLTIEGEAAHAIRVAAVTGSWMEGRRGFGSVRVAARIGGTSWETSLFPDKASGGWLLPVKKAVRAAEALQEGDLVGVSLKI